jgi:hypothetical protein
MIRSLITVAVTPRTYSRAIGSPEADLPRYSMAGMARVAGVWAPGCSAEFKERIQRTRASLLSADIITEKDRNMQQPGLHWAGTDDKVLRKLAQGTNSKEVRFPLSTQRADGLWYARRRAPKFQPYFETGFPYGHDQWISSMATGWATTALASAIGDKPATRARIH